MNKNIITVLVIALGLSAILFISPIRYRDIKEYVCVASPSKDNIHHRNEEYSNKNYNYVIVDPNGDDDSNGVNSIYWSNSQSYSDTMFKEEGWFPEREYHDVEPDFDNKGNNSFFWQCAKEVYSKRWKDKDSVPLNDLIKWVVMPPVVPLNTSCLPPPLYNPEKLNCPVDYPKAGFKEGVRSKPRKIGVAFQFGFETDMLELYLMEVYDVVDKIFIMEAILDHLGASHKRLMWETLKWTPRFKKFQDKVVSLIVDDSGSHPSDRRFRLENEQKKLGFLKIMEWNKKNRFFDDDDMISFGDADEIPSRHSIHALKYCDPINMSETIDIGSVGVYRYIMSVALCDQRLKDYPNVMGSPVFYSMSLMKKIQATNGRTPRVPSKSKHYILGGTHLTYFSYTPQLLIKGYTCTECKDNRVKRGGLDFDSTSLKEMLVTYHKKSFAGLKYGTDLRGKLRGVEYYPWALKCNPLRYKSAAFATFDDRLLLSRGEVPFKYC